MIKKLKLNNFRGIKEGEIDLSPLTILVGSNNSGKTAILESLFLVPNPVRSILDMGPVVSLIHGLHQTLDSAGYGFILHNYQEIPASISCIIDNVDVPYILAFYPVSGTIFLSDNAKSEGHWQVNLKNGNSISAFSSLNVRDAGLSITKADNNIPINSLLINENILRAGYNYIHHHWTNIMNSGVFRRVAQQASGLSMDNYIDFTLEPFFDNRQSIYAFFNDGRRIRLGDLGEGMHSYIVAKILYEAEKPDILLWDDIEAHFNPRMLISLAEWFADIVESGKQVVVSTHSLEAVRILGEMVPEHTSTVLLSLKDNILDKKILSPTEINDLYESGIDVRMAEQYLL